MWVELLLAGGNVVGTVVPVLLMQRLHCIDLRLINMKDALCLTAAGAMGAGLSGLIGTGALMAANGFGWDRAFVVMSNWWFGNVVGTLTVAPLVLAWYDRQDQPIRPGQWLHLAAVALAIAALAYLVFLTPITLNLRTWHIFPVLVWAALAFQVRGAAVGLVIVSVAAILGATLGFGPFVDIADTTAGRVFYAQQFAAITALTILILAAVADERRGKEALERLNADLERRVEEGAARLAQLHKTESLGQLTGGIAHDFNNLLMAVQGSLELMRKRLPPDDERLARLLENAMEGARRGATLTQRLLAFARKQELRPEPVSVAELVVGMADLLGRSLGPQVNIETSLPSGLPKAMADANQLELAILNLGLNARDAMPEGGTLTIAVDEAKIGQDAALPAGRYISVQVRDTGAGMDEATLRRATEPFYSTKGVGKGTGLGLAMVHGLAEQSGGRFSLKSEPGRGTTAEMLLPVAAIASEAPEAGERNEGQVPLVIPSGAGPLTVLVVDDDVLVRMGTADMVAEAGHVAVEAGSGPEALTILRSGRAIDVVVTDHAMPGMTGAQLAATLRTEFLNLPVILASGFAELPPEVDNLIVERLNKPFFQDALVRALDRAAQRAEKVVLLQDQKT